VFLSQDGDPAIDAGSVTSGNTRVSFTPGAKVAIGRDYISATDPWVLRARLRWREEKHQTVSVIICDNSS
jgi:hypothetical protein